MKRNILLIGIVINSLTLTSCNITTDIVNTSNDSIKVKQKPLVDGYTYTIVQVNNIEYLLTCNTNNKCSTARISR